MGSVSGTDHLILCHLLTSTVPLDLVLGVAVVGAAAICSLKALGHSSSNVLGQHHSLEASGSDPVKVHSKERRKRIPDSNRKQMSPGGISHTALLLCCRGKRLRRANRITKP